MKKLPLDRTFWACNDKVVRNANCTVAQSPKNVSSWIRRCVKYRVQSLNSVEKFVEKRIRCRD